MTGIYIMNAQSVDAGIVLTDQCNGVQVCNPCHELWAWRNDDQQGNRKPGQNMFLPLIKKKLCSIKNHRNIAMN